MIQKRLGAKILKCSPQRVWLDPEHLDEIKEAITRFDVRRLIKQGLIRELPIQGHGKFWSRARKAQKRKSRRAGHGSRKGKQSARRNPKEDWMARVRLQRDLLKRLKTGGKLAHKDFTDLYQKSKGGFFRSLHHLKLYLEEQNLVRKK